MEVRETIEIKKETLLRDFIQSLFGPDVGPDSPEADKAMLEMLHPGDQVVVIKELGRIKAIETPRQALG